MAKARKLKVFEAQFGFRDSVVAAPNQAAALEAWGTHQNLFAEGQARVTADAAAVKAALAHPGVPLIRAVGSKGAFELTATGAPVLDDAPKGPKAKTNAKASPKPAPRPAPDRKALDAAERALRTLEDAHGREEADLRRRRSELGRQAAEAEETFTKARKIASSAVAEARRAYRDTGGRG